MNKLTISLLLIFLSTTTFAQIKFAPELGFNVAMQTQKTTMPVTDIVTTEDSKPAAGCSAGLMLDIKILKNLYIQTGAFYFFNNIKYTHNVDLTTYGLGQPQSVQYDRIHQVRVPLYIMYKSGFEGTGRFLAGIGPYAGYAFKGSRMLRVPFTTYDEVTNTVSYSVKTSNTEMKLGSDAYSDQQKMWDLGLNACIGYESNVGLFFKGTFNYGLLNQDPASSDQYRVRNWGFGLSIGYLLGKDGW